VGLIAGLGAVGFRWLIKGVQWLFFNRGAVAFDFLGDNYVILLPAIGGLFVGLLVYFLAREAKGHGVPEVMEAVNLRGGRIRPRVAFIKALASSISIGSGGSVGREGPIAQIGSSIGSTLGQLLRLPDDWIKGLVLAGAAGGISATFNAPIGGVFFALEVIQRRFMARNLGYIVISSVTADVIAHNFLGNRPSFIIPEHVMASHWEMLPYAIMGVLAGFLVFLFVRFFYGVESFFENLKFPEYLKPVLGGIVVGAIALYYPEIFGVGYSGSYSVGGIWLEEGALDLALAGLIAIHTLLILMAAKMVATSFTVGSGGSGGVFAPSLFIGSMMGGAFGIGVYHLFPAITASTQAEVTGAYALVGMGAFFAATARAPITAIVMLFEMTRNYELILPLMTAVVISTLVSRGLSRESIYTLKLVRRGIDVHRREQADFMRNIRVDNVMTRDFPTVRPALPVYKLIDELHESGHHGFPVVDAEGHFCGVVTLQDIDVAMAKADATLTVEDIMTKSPIVAYPDQSIHDAVAQLGGRDVGRIPVVDRSDSKRLLGVLRRHDITRVYTTALER
jgi:CIC family chloride channel protein